MGKVHLLKTNPQLEAVYTIIRDKNTKQEDFIFNSDRLIRLLVEEGLSLLGAKTKKIVTPTGASYSGKAFEGKIAAVSIMRSGEAMEKAVREVCQKIKIGKILIQRDEKTALPHLIYSKLPNDIGKRMVFLLDPMLATGGSACKAIEVLKSCGVKEGKIIFINLIACPEGVKKVGREFPGVRIVTGVIDKGLNSKAFIVPGLGDFGDRYYGT